MAGLCSLVITSVAASANTGRLRGRKTGSGVGSGAGSGAGIDKTAQTAERRAH